MFKANKVRWPPIKSTLLAKLKEPIQSTATLYVICTYYAVIDGYLNFIAISAPAPSKGRRFDFFLPPFFQAHIPHSESRIRGVVVATTTLNFPVQWR